MPLFRELPWFSLTAQACRANAVISDYCTATAVVFAFRGSVPCKYRDREYRAVIYRRFRTINNMATKSGQRRHSLRNRNVDPVWISYFERLRLVRAVSRNYIPVHIIYISIWPSRNVNGETTFRPLYTRFAGILPVDTAHAHVHNVQETRDIFRADISDRRRHTCMCIAGI